MVAGAGRWPILALLLFGLLVPGQGRAAQTVPLHVLLNEESKGDHFVILQPDGGIWIAAKDLAQIGLEPTSDTMVMAGVPYVSLQSLAPGVDFTFDPDKLEVRLTVDPAKLPLQVVDLSQTQPQDLVHPDDNSAYLNYAVTYTKEDDVNTSALRIPTEIAVRLGSTLAYSSYSYEREGQSTKSVRMLSNLNWDMPDARRRIVLGDTGAGSGRLGGGLLVGGIRIATEQSLKPYDLIYPGLNIEGVLATPADVEVKVNDITVHTAHMAAGRFELRNLPYAIGAGETVLIIRDSFGRETRVQAPFYVSSNLLKPGLHDYSYTLGVEREELGEKNAEYGLPALLAYHRYGVSDAFTFGIRGEAQDDIANLGASVGIRLWRLGEIDVGTAFSEDRRSVDGRRIDGRGGYFGYQYASKRFGLQAFVQRMSPQYATVGFSAIEDKPRLLTSNSIGLPMGDFGSIGFSRYRQANYESEDTTTESVFYTNKFGNAVSLSLRAARERKESGGIVETTRSFVASLLVSFGEGYSAGASVAEEDDALTESLSFQKGAPEGPGWGYRLDAQRDESAPPGEQWGGNAFLLFNGPWGAYQLSRNQRSEGSNSALTAAGSLAYVGGSLMLSRPINDAFALVRVGKLPNIRVYSSNHEMGRTDGDGDVLVPNLLSYYGNDLSIGETDAPFDYTIGKLHLRVAPPYRSGAVVRFDVQRIQAFTGRVFFQQGDVREPATLAGLDIDVEGSKRTSVVGKGGLFYVERLPPGSHPARLFTEKRECKFTLTVPERDETLVDMGEINCVLP